MQVHHSEHNEGHNGHDGTVASLKPVSCSPVFESRRTPHQTRAYWLYRPVFPQDPLCPL